ncbi:MAG TPA: beta-ketoacyl synthase N-terminal-like domain-containing protein, partial [Candidatus Polarisedimenticolia bacterium]|nr:beta-ketoacyl synthase N-terminal-like domain-containing protein [Candidatus Polarisedimenticolia bacterium]
MSSEQRHHLEVAVVGMALRFPGASSAEALWANLRDGVESIRDLSGAELMAAGVDPAAAGPRRVRRAAPLEGIELFDAALFGLTPREAELMDPQLRVFLQDCWAALEDAGRLSDRDEVRVGVFAGASASTYLRHNVAAGPRAAEAMESFLTHLGNGRDYVATQVSYRLGLRGPSLTVQTACSTSLVAVHLACQSLLNGECDLALAGGVSITVPQTAGYEPEEGGIESPDGRVRAFDAAAAGCVKGNGSGVVVLRRLADALRDGDDVRAVIKGSAVNNDGAVKAGFTAPSEQGQAEVIAEALAAAGVEPSSVSLIEAHGTATPLGDPVEAAALARVFGPPRPGARPCALGSVKTNLGHLDAAAGVAGLIKAVLALRHRTIPPSLHFERPNPAIDFSRTPFHVPRAAASWEPGAGPRRAGVSSFGIGGTNAHVVLEEAPAPAPRARREQEEHLLVLSAADEGALAEASEALAGRLASGDPPDLADTAFTLHAGRKR